MVAPPRAALEKQPFDLVVLYRLAEVLRQEGKTAEATKYQDEDSVAVDGSGKVYIADYYNNAIKELPRAFPENLHRKIECFSVDYQLLRRRYLHPPPPVLTSDL